MAMGQEEKPEMPTFKTALGTTAIAALADVAANVYEAALSVQRRAVNDGASEEVAFGLMMDAHHGLWNVLNAAHLASTQQD